VGLNSNGRNACLAGLAAAITYISAHTGLPDANGSSEVTGGSYARVPVTWAAPSGGTRGNSGTLTIEIPAATTVTHLGYWSALTGGTHYGHSPVNATVDGYGLVGTNGVTIDSATALGHGLVDGRRVAFLPCAGDALPGGISTAVLYYVVAAGTDTFSISLTSGGAAVDLTSPGKYYFQSCVPEVFAGAGQLTIVAGALLLDATLT
jgi:hypothetical protein